MTKHLPMKYDNCIDKFTKLSKFGFSMKGFTADVS